MTQPINTESIAKATGKTWDDWVKDLDARGARQLSHKDLARQLYDELDGQIDNHGWWVQGITVAYEQHIGRRVPGQLVNGKFELAVSKTIQIPRDQLFPTIVNWFENQADLNQQKFTQPRSSQTPKRSNWRCNFADGSKFAATVEDSGDKSKLVLSHTDVPTKSEADNWKEFWKSVATKLT